VKCIRLRDPPLDIYEFRGNVVVGGVLNLAATALLCHLYSAVPVFDAVVAHDAHGALVVMVASTLQVRSVYYVHMWTHSPLDVLGAVSGEESALQQQAHGVPDSEEHWRDARVVYPASPYEPVEEPSNTDNEEPVVLIPSASRRTSPRLSS
jgi:hypothetical protein